MYVGYVLKVHPEQCSNIVFGVLYTVSCYIEPGYNGNK